MPEQKVPLHVAEKVAAERDEAQQKLSALQVAVEYAEGQLRGGSAIGKIPQANAARAYRRLEKALDLLDSSREDEA